MEDLLKLLSSISIVDKKWWLFLFRILYWLNIFDPVFLVLLQEISKFPQRKHWIIQYFFRDLVNTSANLHICIIQIIKYIFSKMNKSRIFQKLLHWTCCFSCHALIIVLATGLSIWEYFLVHRLILLHLKELANQYY